MLYLNIGFIPDNIERGIYEYVLDKLQCFCRVFNWICCINNDVMMDAKEEKENNN